jgi:fatty-acyl-CoA synthase
VRGNAASGASPRPDQTPSPSAGPTVGDHLRARAEQDHPGLMTGDRIWNWRLVVAEAGRRANAVRTLLDPKRPAHVGLLMGNTPEMLHALNAGALGGFVPVGVNATRRGAALAADLQRADCQLVLTDHAHRALLSDLELPQVQVIDTDAPGWTARWSRQPSVVTGAAETTEDATFMLIFTSGTSGAPKAVRMTHRMVVNSGEHLAKRFGIGPADVCYQSMPMFHSNAVVAGYAVALVSGAALALAPRFSASRFLPDIRRYGATYLNYVGKPLAYVLRTPRRTDDAQNPLRVAFGNEASERDIAEFAERFDTQVVDGFGSTEGAVLISRGEDTPPGSIGTPWPGVAVYDRVTGKECPRAEFDATGRVINLGECVGELVNTTGGGYFAGYYGDPEATAERMSGGMFWSGDLAYRDESGYVYLAGRSGDWLRVDGENLAAGPLEQILLRHPAISQAAVYGVPDPDAGDRLVAALVLRDELTAEGFERFLDQQKDLSTKSRPQYVRICRELPSTATNKVIKRELVSQGTDFTDDCWIRAERGTGYTLREGAR